jgi:hypothetical protein
MTVDTSRALAVLDNHTVHTWPVAVQIANIYNQQIDMVRKDASEVSFLGAFEKQAVVDHPKLLAWEEPLGVGNPDNHMADTDLAMIQMTSLVCTLVLAVYKEVPVVVHM